MLSKEQSQLGKGLAISLIIFYHLALEDFGWLNYIGMVGVFIFLILSGYGLAASLQSGHQKSWLKRVLLLLIPYWIASMLKILLLPLFGEPLVPLKQYPEIFLGLDVTRVLDPSMWFILYIIFWYSVIYLVFKAVSNEKLRIGLLVLVALLLVFVRYPNWLTYALAFPIGVWLKQNESKISSWLTKMQKWSLWRGCLILAISILLISLMLLDNRVIAIFPALVCAIVLLIYMMQYPLFWKKCWFFLGGCSYELYLMEGFPIFTFDLVGLYKMPLQGFIMYLVVLIGMTFVLIKLEKPCQKLVRFK